MATIKKRTNKVTIERQALDLYKDLTEDQKKDLHLLLGKIICGETKNFHTTKVYKTLKSSLDANHGTVVTYICVKASKAYAFENMEDLTLNKE